MAVGGYYQRVSRLVAQIPHNGINNSKSLKFRDSLISLFFIFSVLRWQFLWATWLKNYCYTDAAALGNSEAIKLVVILINSIRQCQSLFYLSISSLEIFKWNDRDISYLVWILILNHNRVNYFFPCVLGYVTRLFNILICINLFSY